MSLHIPKRVMLRSGGPQMEVVAISPTIFECEWTDDSGSKVRQLFHRETLTHVVKLWLITPKK